MPEQLSLFGEENTTYNTAVQHLLELRFAAAMKGLEDYRRFFPWAKDVDREIDMARFWMTRLEAEAWDPSGPEDPEGMYGLWLEFEKAFDHPWDEYRIEHTLQRGMFSRLVEGMARRVDERRHTLPRGTPVGLMFLRAGHGKEAVSRLQALVRAEPENARGYGYLGDAHTCRSDREAAMACYQRALSLDPEALDRDHILCGELVRELKDFESRQGEGARALAWFPAVAQRKGLFEPFRMIDLDELRFWLARFRRLLDNGGGPRDATQNPMIFVHAMVLSDNAAMAGRMPGFDLFEIRKTMKEIDEDLFSWHMRMLQERESGIHGHSGRMSPVRGA